MAVALKERILSACSGSFITSLVLTPMDVTRIRLQQQELLPECNCKLSINPGGTISDFNKVFWQHACFQDINCKQNSIKFKGTLDALIKIAQIEGITTLWRGLSVTLLMAIPANVVYFAGYESLRDNSPLKTIYPQLNPLVCGALARTIAATTIAPLELFRTRIQSIPRSSKLSTSSMMLKDLMNEMKIEASQLGYKALFKGLQITLWRDVPFSGLYWSTYEFYKKNCWLEVSLISSFYEFSSSSWEYFINGFLGGSLSGTIAALVTHPFDVGKTRMQISLHPSDLQRTVSTAKIDSNIHQSKNMFMFLNEIKNREGFSALYTGLFPRILKIAPSCAIMISTYEISKKLFDS